MIYWTWDYQKTDNFYANKVQFLDRDFDTKFWINLLSTEYTGTESCGYHLRYVYYKIPLEVSGTLYTNISNGIYNDPEFIEKTSLDESIEILITKWYVPMFWIIWIIIIILCVIGFYYLDNNWLNN